MNDNQEIIILVAQPISNRWLYICICNIFTAYMYSLYTRIKVIESGNGHLVYDNVKVKLAISIHRQLKTLWKKMNARKRVMLKSSSADDYAEQLLQSSRVSFYDGGKWERVIMWKFLKCSPVCRTCLKHQRSHHRRQLVKYLPMSLSFINVDSGSNSVHSESSPLTPSGSHPLMPSWSSLLYKQPVEGWCG